MEKRTPLHDISQKIDIIEHINDNHPKELKAIVADYVDETENINPLIDDIVEEGCLVSVGQGSKRQQIFVPFRIKGNIEEKVMYTAYSAMVKQGKTMGGGNKRYFEVLETQNITKHMLRLVLNVDQPLPDDRPGFAFLLAQKTLEKIPDVVDKKTSNTKKAQYVARLLLWVMKVLSRKQRRKMMANMNKGLRYYTLRQTVKREDKNGSATIAYIDIYLHGDTAGSLWAKKLRAGDVIYSNKEYEEHSDHLHQGQAVLLADETALPALASMVEQWKNPLPPIVVIITADEADQAYFSEEQLPANGQCRRFTGIQATLTHDIINYLKTLPTIDTVWGAMENQTAKAIRAYFRNERGLEGKCNKVKGYWRA